MVHHMIAENFPRFVALVWPENGDFGSPTQGYHVTPSDSLGCTNGGEIEATWQACVARGIVTGVLRTATLDQPQAVLQAERWGSVCDALPDGVDVLVANGPVMSGRFPWLFQKAMGFTDDDVDGAISIPTASASRDRTATTSR
jgi:lysozyme family protein